MWLFLIAGCIPIAPPAEEETNESPEIEPVNSGFTFTGTLPNGLVDDKRVTYTTTAIYDGNDVVITFDGGSNFEWVWLYTPGHVSMENKEGNIWTAKLPGHSSGSTLTYYFTVRKNGQEANNHNSPHIWQIGQTDIDPEDSSAASDKWQVVWEDNFTGSGQPNPANWSYHVGNGYNNASNAFTGWGNGEWEWYRPENAFVEGGNLVIRGDYASSPTVIGNRNNYQFSARMTTQGKHAWKYGRIEARIALPKAAGTWPAFWMMGEPCDATYTTNYDVALSYYDTMASNWSSCGEIDIMEHRNSETGITQNFFWDSRTGLFPWADGYNANIPSKNIYVGNVSDFHLYTLEWDATELRWYVDREINPTPTKTQTITAANQEEFHRPFFIILNLAIQGEFTGPMDPIQTDFPIYMYVDYVRVWQRN